MADVWMGLRSGSPQDSRAKFDELDAWENLVIYIDSPKGCLLTLSVRVIHIISIVVSCTLVTQDEREQPV